MSANLTLAVRQKEDVLWAKQEIKRFIASLPFKPEDVARIEVAVSELASNMVKHAGGGRLVVDRIRRDTLGGVRIAAVDSGPGIPDLRAALKSGFSTSGTLGMGLPTVQETMDRFEITTDPGQGTRVEVEKWAT